MLTNRFEVTFDYAENEEFKAADEDTAQELKIFHIDDTDDE